MFRYKYYIIIISVLLFTLYYYADREVFEDQLDYKLESFGIDIVKTLTDVRLLSNSSRHNGSQGHAKARQHITERLRSSGVTVNQDHYLANAVIKERYVNAHIHNIKGFLPATANNNTTKNIAFLAHYDSSESTFGANDNAVGVSALLAVAEVMASQSMRRNNIWFIFVDAEEIALMGAKALSEIGFMKNMNLVVNLEARGASGHSVIFEAIGKEGTFIKFMEFSDVAVSDSVILDIYQILPNMTDVDELKVGVGSELKLMVNVAYFGDGFAYHNSYDNYESVNVLGLKHHIAYMLDIVRFAEHHIIDSQQENHISERLHFVKNIGKNNTAIIEINNMTIISYMITFIFIVLFIFRVRIYIKKGRVRYFLISSTAGLVMPIIAIIPIVGLCLIFYKLFGNVFAFSALGMITYLIISISIFLTSYLLVSKYLDYEAFRIGVSFSIAFFLLLSALFSNPLMIPLALASMINGTYNILCYKTHKLAGFISLLFVFIFIFINSQLIEVLQLLGGLKAPLFLTAFISICCYGVINDVIKWCFYFSEKQDELESNNSVLLR
jgi:hypothetical protein